MSGKLIGPNIDSSQWETVVSETANELADSKEAAGFSLYVR